MSSVRANMGSLRTTITALSHLIRAEGTMFNTIGRFRLFLYSGSLLLTMNYIVVGLTQNRLESMN